MLRASILFFTIGLIAFAVGATGLGWVSMDLGKILLEAFMVLAALTFIGALFTGRKHRLY